MERKDNIDLVGAVALIAFSAALGLNQVVVKLVNDGLQPVFSAALRSLFSTMCLLAWMRFRRIPLRVAPEAFPYTIIMGVAFAAEFICLFTALDLTTVARSSVIFYTMPVWLALMAHLLVPGDQLTRRKALGLGLALSGVAWAILDRPDHGEARLAGDLLALIAAWGWAGIALLTKVSPFARVRPELQLLSQVMVSAPILLLATPLFGPAIRDFVPLHALGVAFQVALVAGGYLVWFGLLKIYPASGVASFAFLSPVVGVIFGWLLLGESVGVAVWGALVLVALGLILINRPPRASVKSAQIGK